MVHVLVVDDDLAILRTLTISLRAHGYDVLTAPDGTTAMAACREDKPDLLILDLGLPDVPGIEVLHDLRTWSTVPVIVLSARQGSNDKVQALDSGADDYVTKPFGIEELLARVRATVRRTTPTEEPTEVSTESFRIDLDAKRAWRDDTQVRLTPTEWGLLQALVTRPGSLVSQRRLLQEVWGPNYGSETNYLRVYMASLRRKLEQDPARPRHFITEPGMGYRFMP